MILLHQGGQGASAIIDVTALTGDSTTSFKCNRMYSVSTNEKYRENIAMQVKHIKQVVFKFCKKEIVV